MESQQQEVPSGQQNDEQFLTVLKELEMLKEDYVGRKIRIYGGWANQARLRFRISSLLIIGLSVCLPFLTTLREGIWISLVLPLVALVIAGLSSLNTFFRWEGSWKGFSQTRYTLEYLVKLWELKVIEAKHEKDAQKSVEMVVQATKELLDNVQSATSTEAEEFFKRVQIPKAPPS